MNNDIINDDKTTKDVKDKNYIIVPTNNSIKDLSNKLKSSSLLTSNALEELKKSINLTPINLGINDKFRNTISELAKQQLSLSSLYFNKSVIESMTNSLTCLNYKSFMGEKSTKSAETSLYSVPPLQPLRA